MMAANYFLKHITKLHPGWIFRKAKGAREARKETLTLELNANVS